MRLIRVERQIRAECVRMRRNASVFGGKCRDDA